MNPTENQKLQDNKQAEQKKAYRKPSVQVYGSLSEMTQSSPPSTTTKYDATNNSTNHFRT